MFAMVLALCAAASVFGSQCALAQNNDDHNSAEIRNAFRGVMQDRSSGSPEEALFVEKCGMCHRQWGMGTVILARRMDPAKAMLETRNDLSAEYIGKVVREGLGNMPKIPRGEVSDKQLKSIIGYLVN